MSEQLPLTHFLISEPQDAPPVWPLPMLGNRGPQIVGTGERWHSVKLGYAAHVVQPKLVPVLAVGNGEVSIATDNHVGIHHRNGFETHYAKLAHVMMKPRTSRMRRAKQWVRAGELIGLVEAGQPLLFEIWQREACRAYTTVSIGSHVRCWRDVAWMTEVPQSEAPQIAA